MIGTGKPGLDEVELKPGFVTCRGHRPVSEQHHGAKLGERFQEARDFYVQQALEFIGVVDEAEVSEIKAAVATAREVLEPAFGPLIVIAEKDGLGLCFPEYQIEDGLMENNPMRGARPLVWDSGYVLENPDAADEIGSTIAADLIDRGIAVPGPLTVKLRADLRKKNQELLAAQLAPKLANLSEIPVLG